MSAPSPQRLTPPLMMLVSLLCLASLMVTTALASCSCGDGQTCYRNQCKTAEEISILAFETGNTYFK